MAILIFDYDGTIHDSMVIYEPAVRACYERLVALGLLPERIITREEIETYIGLTAREMWDIFAPGFTDEQKEMGSGIIREELHRLTNKGEARLYEGVPQMLMTLKEKGHRLVYLSACHISYKEAHTKYFHLDQYFDEMYCTEEFGWIHKYEIVRELIRKWQREAAVPGPGTGIEAAITAAPDPGTGIEAAITAASGPATGIEAAITAAPDLYIVESAEADAGCNADDNPSIIAIGDRSNDMAIRKASDTIKTIWCAYGFGQSCEGADADAIAGSPGQIPEIVDGLLVL